MRDLSIAFVLVLVAAVLVELFIPQVSYSDIIVTAILLVALITLDIVVKAVKAFFGGDSPE